MAEAQKTDTVQFTVKGQVVIPRWLRKEFEIEEGTKAHVSATANGILLQPVTARYIRTLRGSLKGTKAMEIFLRERKKERGL